MTLISYARNFEDVMLWRALKHVGKGSYIDCCARDPLIDSVSLAFYEMGWRGMNFTDAEHFQKLKAARSDEDVISDSSALERISLSEIHWARIDKRMLEAFFNHQIRPWIVLFENPDEKDETALRDKGYNFVYFDGLTRFYLSDQHLELASAFSAPPNLFDDFALGGRASNSFCSLLNSRIEKLELELQKLLESKKEYEKKIGKLSSRLLDRNKQWAARFAGKPKAAYPESAHLNPRIQRIYARLVQAMEGKT